MADIQHVQSFRRKFRLYPWAWGWWKRNNLRLLALVMAGACFALIIWECKRTGRQVKSAGAWATDYEKKLDAIEAGSGLEGRAGVMIINERGHRTIKNQSTRVIFFATKDYEKKLEEIEAGLD